MKKDGARGGEANQDPGPESTPQDEPANPPLGRRSLRVQLDPSAFHRPAERNQTGTHGLARAALETERHRVVELLVNRERSLEHCAHRPETGRVDKDLAWLAQRAGDTAMAAGEPDRARRAYQLALEHWTAMDKADEIKQVQERMTE